MLKNWKILHFLHQKASSAAICESAVPWVFNVGGWNPGSGQLIQSTFSYREDQNFNSTFKMYWWVDFVVYLAWAPVCTFWNVQGGAGHQLAHLSDVHTGARTWTLCCTYIHEETLNFRDIKLKFCILIALGMPNNINNFQLDSISKNKIAAVS